MASWPNLDDRLRSVGFTIHPHTAGQTERFGCSGSFHCSEEGATAADYGTAQYADAVLWAIFNELAQFAYGPGRIVEELAYKNRAIDGGRDVGAWPNHDDHVHAALVPGRLLPIASGDPDTMLLDLTDISEFQAPGFGIGRDGVIIRAANGRRLDYEVDGHVDAVRRAGAPLSLYAYCEPGVRDPEFTADLLIGVAARHGVPKNVVLWADIEQGDGDLRWYEDRFVARVNAAGWMCGVYSGDYFWGAHNLAGRQGRWVAAYGVNNGTVNRDPLRAWDIHQYTSYPNLDKNRAMRSVRDRLFGRASAPKRRKGGQLMCLWVTKDTGKSYLQAPEGFVEVSNDGAAQWSQTGMPSRWCHSLEIVLAAQRLRIPINGEAVPAA